MSSARGLVRTVALPGGSAVASVYVAPDYVDAYAVELPAGASGDPEVLARFLFDRPSGVGRFLLRVRDALVGLWGLKTASRALASGLDGGRIGIFRVFGRSRGEILLGEDDKHLDFRVSVLCPDALPASVSKGGRQLTLATVIRYHNAFGRLYFFVVAPFHRGLVKSALRRASRSGWPLADDGGTSCKQRLPGSDPSP